MTTFGSIIQDVLRAKYKGCEYAVGETYESLKWMPSNTVAKPTVQQLQQDIADYQANKESYDWEQMQAEAMPTVEERLNMLWDAIDQGIDLIDSEFYTSVLQVRQRYPKRV